MNPEDERKRLMEMLKRNTLPTPKACDALLKRQNLKLPHSWLALLRIKNSVDEPPDLGTLASGLDTDLGDVKGNPLTFFGDNQELSWQVFKLERDLTHHFLTSMLSFAVQYFLLPSGLVVTPNPKTTYSDKTKDSLAYAVAPD